ncbi:Aprataxin [Porphyridium purpureum]|uniref:Aprataxin n=1 Tax=Porphyridium purpureum TaxID=35688 RepID=A0A5J4YXF9_PORPP|nr:Aprataxin [Porphyridium purpureum]|eukprot:POR0389..scf209_3
MSKSDQDMKRAFSTEVNVSASAEPGVDGTSSTGSSRKKQLKFGDDGQLVDATTSEEPQGTKRRTDAASGGGYWKTALTQKSKLRVLHQGKDFFAIKDIYPKAHQHLLLVSELQGLNSVWDLNTAEHLDHLKNMLEYGKSLGHKFPGDCVRVVPFVRIGLHAIPSCIPLHIHVISQDCDSGWMKSKKHYNSFKEPFFLDLEWIIEHMEAEPPLALTDVLMKKENYEEALKAPLTCHRCGKSLENMPKVKWHVKRCSSAFSSPYVYGWPSPVPKA